LPVAAFNAEALAQTKEKVAVIRPDAQWLHPTGYSNPLIVCHYLVRLQPFTAAHVHLQDGRFDAPDRIFQSVPRSFNGLHTKTGSTRELTPEFFFLPEFLSNLDGLELGARSDGADLNTVETPDWAAGPVDFIRKHAVALESLSCTAGLPAWIDLIWGFRQLGEEAVAADNTFDAALYPAAVVADDTRASKLQLVGQIPWQLLTSKHLLRSEFTPPVVEAKPLEIPGAGSLIVAFCVEGVALDSIRLFAIDRSGKCISFRKSQQQQILACEAMTSQRRYVSVSDSEFACVEVGRSGILSLCPKKKRIVKSQHRAHIAAINCIASSGNYIVTGGCDALVALWVRKKDRIDICGDSAVHNDVIACVTVSVDYGVVVSCSTDGNVSVFRIPDLFFIRSIDLELQNEIPPSRVVVAKAFGDIIVFLDGEDRVTIAKRFTINGTPIGTVKINGFIREFCCLTNRKGLDVFVVLKDNGVVEMLNSELVALKALNASVIAPGTEFRGIAVQQGCLYLATLTTRQTFMLIGLAID
jgi:hypothetical protein